MSEIAQAPKLLPGCGFYLDVFGDYGKIKMDQLFPIATQIRYTHQAAVVRWGTQNKSWRITEPNISWDPPILEKEDNENIIAQSKDFLLLETTEPSNNFWCIQADKNINKDILVWKQTGIAYVFGYVKRGIGKSHSSSHYSGMYGEGDYDPGWFDAKAYVPLYAVKSHLPGLSYSFVPIQCAEIV